MIQAFLIKLLLRKVQMEILKRILKTKRAITALVLLVATGLGLALPAEVTDAIVLLVSTALESK